MPGRVTSQRMTCNTVAEYRLDSDESYAEGIVRGMATVHDVAPRSLPPLYDAIDSEALEALLASLESNATSRTGRVTFIYNDHTVTVESDGTICLTPD